jgi:hypothetical protein
MTALFLAVSIMCALTGAAMLFGSVAYEQKHIRPGAAFTMLAILFFAADVCVLVWALNLIMNLLER